MTLYRTDVRRRRPAPWAMALALALLGATAWSAPVMADPAPASPNASPATASPAIAVPAAAPSSPAASPAAKPGASAPGASPAAAGASPAPARSAAPATPRIPRPAPTVAATLDLRDVPSDHWAYRAILALGAKYHVMEGFPDKTFRGAKTVTRYELAAALVKIMERMDQLAATPGGGAPASRPLGAGDQLTIERLRGEFRTELDALTARVGKDEDTLKALQDKLGKIVTLGGRVRSQIADDLLDVGKDRAAPYIATELNVKFKGTLSPATTYDTMIAGAVKAGGSGDVPGVMQDALGKAPTADTVSVKTARFTTKVGSTTINVGRFPLWLTGFGPSSDLAWRTGDFIIGVGGLSQDVSQERVGSDVGATVQTDFGPMSFWGGLNSNILITQMKLGLGPFGLKGGFETDHKAITQNLFGSGPVTKTTRNAAVTVDVGGEGPYGATLQANLTNESLTNYGLGLRAAVAGIDLNFVSAVSADPGKSVTVASFGPTIGLPAYPLFGLKTPAVLFGAVDHYTINAPPRADNKPTTGPGGQALGKNAGITLQLGLDNPIIPNLVFEYNAQAKLIEDILIPSGIDPITSESYVLRSTLDF